jgi:pentapeptide MXKDX repeat protein
VIFLQRWRLLRKPVGLVVGWIFTKPEFWSMRTHSCEDLKEVLRMRRRFFLLARSHQNLGIAIFLSKSEMSNDKMSNDKMSNDKMSNDKMSNDKMSNDKMSNNKMSNNKMLNTKMSNKKYWTTKCQTTKCRNSFCA